MDPTLIATISILVMLGLMAFGIPVAVSMLLVSATGMMFAVGPNYTLTTFQTLPYNTAANYTFAAIPMFVLMGLIAGSTGIVKDIYQAANMWLAKIRGGLYMATVIAAAGFGAVNGSTIVGAALFTRIALPEMISLGYNKGAGVGCIIGAGTFAAMIPPSITIVLYGVLTSESIGQLLMAGIIPGVLTGIIYLIGIAFLVRIKPAWAPPAVKQYSLQERLKSIKGVWPIGFVSFIVIGGIYSGLVSPSAAGAIGAFGVLLVGWVLRRLSKNELVKNVGDAALITAALFFIVMGGTAFSRLLLVTGFIDVLLDFVNNHGFEPWMIILALVLVYIVLGMLMDPISMMVMTVPIVHPLVVGLGYDPIWFAIVMVKLIELSCMTPPVGINIFAAISASDGQVSTKEVYIGVIPFVILELIVLALLLSLPGIALFLPEVMLG
ncbi:TRAP transporter large permease [Vreelandella maris]|uniref:TRAP transporter large permease protein n=1 Tax=Vreelandella maris TaxID=2729617 RepID=A0A7Y6RFH3_9GAMM|nr:TRAP transporter large permease subunit [Halomonas maris]NVF15806.1 TRAP transporter large permease subunit [Halomonas maris]|tara:strand:+ start:5572 stop:6882 length:1311 start_codon:yes stop_codon:yes gene_type:complete